MMKEEKKINHFLFLFYALVSALIIFIIIDNEGQSSESSKKLKTKPVVEEKPLIKLNEFGLAADSFHTEKNYIKRNETLSSILLRYKIPSEKIHRLSLLSKDVFDLRKIVSGKTYHIFTKNSSDQLDYFIYEKDPVSFVVLELKDSIRIYEGKKEVKLRRKTLTGVIENSLYACMQKNDASQELMIKLADVFAWEIDFHSIQKGDHFKVIYEEQYIGDQPIGIGRIFGAYFNHNRQSFYAIDFKQDNVNQYFDENGASLRKAFLKAPLEFTRISSRYSKRRFHPVQKRMKPHLGTDYAAPSGTPIRTVGDGVVTAASYTRGNGYYVKVKHNVTYTTQYLHMSRFAKGIRAGTPVKQGDVIGYVGSTGLATGLHLCFRFWKNGKQVDPLKEEIPPSHPVKEEYMEAFNKRKNAIISELDSLIIPEIKNLAANNKIETKES